MVPTTTVGAVMGVHLLAAKTQNHLHSTWKSFVIVGWIVNSTHTHTHLYVYAYKSLKYKVIKVLSTDSNNLYEDGVDTACLRVKITCD